ncbi:MAG: hypothetical protein ACE5EA_01485 [Nitrospirota bacterium]
MNRWKKLIILCLLISICLSPSVSRGQPYRDNLSIPPAEIYKKIMDYISRRDYVKIEKSIVFISPLIKELEKRYNTEIEPRIRDAIQKRDDKALLKSIQRLIFLDISDLFKLIISSMQESHEKAKVKLKIAYLDYMILSQEIQMIDFMSDKKIRNRFRKISFIFDNLSPYKREDSMSSEVENISKMTKAIENEILKAFPEFKEE